MEIQLTQDKVTFIDDEDWKKIKSYRWIAHKGKNTFYAIAYIKGSGKKNQKFILLHRLIVNPNSDQQIDHIDRNGLNNRKINLRIATTAQNNVNAKLSKKNKSGLRGVSLHKHSNLWRATIQFNKKHINTGYLKINGMQQ